MEILEAIHTRRSIRKYQDKPVPGDLLRTVLAAAMSAPSAANKQPWHFVVIDKRAILDAIPGVNPHAEMARGAPLAVLVCGDATLELPSGYWVLDCAAAVENMLLAAHGVGLGAVWTGIYPQQQRMEGYRRLLGLPGHILPHSLIVLGYPAEYPGTEDRYREDRVRYNRW